MHKNLFFNINSYLDLIKLIIDGKFKMDQLI